MQAQVAPALVVGHDGQHIWVGFLGFKRPERHAQERQYQQGRENESHRIVKTGKWAALLILRLFIPLLLLMKSLTFVFFLAYFSVPQFRQEMSVPAAVRRADVVVYGGTSAAVTAAVQVMKMGKSVIIVSPDKHLGGLSSGGLGYTDTGNKEVIGGLSREFYQRLYSHYQKPDAWRWQKPAGYGNKGQGTPAIDGANRTMWIFEPHAAECTNLLVPVCVSSSHIAYGSIRMEPVFMILGQSAATAAVLSIRNRVALHQLPYANLRTVLLRDGQRLTL